MRHKHRTKLQRVLSILLVSILVIQLFQNVIVTASAETNNEGETTTVAGVIKDPNGNVIGGATVSLEGGELAEGEDAPVSTTDQEGKFSFEDVDKAVSYTLKVEMSQYQEASVEVIFGISNDIIIVPLDYEPIYFNFDRRVITYGDTPIYPVSNGMDKEIEYSVIAENPEDEVIANVKEDGEIQTLLPGTASIVAKNVNNPGEIASYELIINKANQEIKFPSTEYNVIVDSEGKAEFSEPVVQQSTGNDVTVEYIVESDPDDIIQNISEDYEITFTGKEGSATIKAIKAGDNCYYEANDTYTINTTTKYKIQSTKNGEWYNSDIDIIAQDGYLLSDSEDGEYVDYLTNVFKNDGIENTFTFYAKEEDSDIIRPFTISGVNIDREKPEVSISLGEKRDWNEKLYVIDSSVYNGDYVEFSILRGDSFSGVASIDYYIQYDDEEIMTDEEIARFGRWNEYKDDTKIRVYGDNKFVVYARVKDNAGNISYAHTGVVVYDKTSPSVRAYIEGGEKDGYSEDVAIVVEAYENHSGLKAIQYRINTNFGDGEWVTLVDFNTPEYSYWKSNEALNNTIIVSVEKYKKEIVTVEIRAVDNANNITSNPYTKEFVMYGYGPNIETVIADEPIVLENGLKIYSSEQVMDIYVLDHIKWFMKPDITIVAKDAEGNTLDITVPISNEWTENRDEFYKLNKIDFSEDAIYSYTIEYTNSKNKTAEPKTGTFAIDKTAPIGAISVQDKSWNALYHGLKFNSWSKDTVEVSIAAMDNFKEEVNIKYLIDYCENDDYKIKSDGELDNLLENQWIEYTQPIQIEPDEKFVVYARLEDNVGNYRYISTEGHIIEDNIGTVTATPIDAPNVNGYYSDDFKVGISVDDTCFEGTNGLLSSGIKYVKYWVETNKVVTVEQTIYDYDVKKIVESKWDGEITISAKDNNSKEVKLFVEVKDNAGNVYGAEQPAGIYKVNTVKPEIEISYDNNTYGKATDNNTYFGSDRIATIAITDREDTFCEQAAIDGISIVAKDKDGNDVEVDFGEIKWTLVDGKYQTTICFKEDAKYTLSVNYTNIAGLSCSSVKVAEGTIAPFKFVIDQTEPEGYINIEETQGGFVWWLLTYVDKKIVAEIGGSDLLSPIDIWYYISDKELTEEELNNITPERWAKYYSKIEINDEQTVFVYGKIVDYAGNYVYVDSDGYVIDKTAPKIELDIPESAHKHGDINIYNEDVVIGVKVNETVPYSGIKQVSYKVLCDGQITQEEVLYSYSEEDGIKTEYIDEITVNASLNNSCDVKVIVEVEDMVGNKGTNEDNGSNQPCLLDIDITEPIVKLVYDNNKSSYNNAHNYYFDNGRTATLTIIEKAVHFDANEAMKAVQIASSNNTNIDPKAGKRWTTVGNTHTLELDFTSSSNYTMNINYMDLAGNVASVIDTTNQVAPYKFTVDTIAPTGSITVENIGMWNELLKGISFSKWSKDTHKVTIEAGDSISDVRDVYYYKSARKTVMTEAELNNVIDWTRGTEFSLNKDEQCVIYVKIVDMAGNVKYICSEGIVIDKTLPTFENLEAAITITPQQPVNGIYTDNVPINVKVVDITNGGICSGIKNVRYEVYNNGIKTQEEVIFDKISMPTFFAEWSKKGAIVVDKIKNNSNNVKVIVYVIDMAGNEIEQAVDLKLDTTSPKIDIAYDNNTADTSFIGETLFKGNRVATIKVTERNFDPNDVVIDVTNTDGVKPVLSNWTVSKRGTGNGDDTEYMATLTYSADGDYKFDIKYADEAGNVCTDIDYGQSLAPREFTIDKTLPIIQVSYDNNNVSNGNYYSQNRTATIIVTEHNFDSSRFNLVLTATDNGVQSQLPVAGQWSSNGDVHRITVPFIVDGYYTIDADFMDKAGNAATDIAAQSFYIDKTNPKLSVLGITDRSANNDDVIGLEIISTDTNIDNLEAQIYAIVQSNGTYKTENIDISSAKKITNGYKITVPNFEADGMYKVVCYANDKAGNVFTEVILDNGQGSTYVENRGNGEELMSFSVNRDGSVYVFDQNLEELKNSYKLSIENDIRISEFNADKLLQDSVSISITRDGSPLDNVKVEKSAIEDGSSWNQYDYIISKDNFKLDGIYVITVSSQDAAGNHSGNIADDKYDISFCVDSTKPDVIRMSNLDNNTFNEVSHIVEYEVFDAIGLKEIRIYLDGKRIQTITEAEFGDNITSYLGSFTIDEASKKQHIRIEVVDIAGNIIDSDNAEDIKSGKIVSFEKDITVSTNPFVRWYSNAPLFYGSIVAAIAVIGGMVGLVTLRNKRKIRVK